MEHSIRQQQIIEASRRIITQKGMSQLTVREIAGELKMTDGAIYRHFKSKKEIVRLMIEDIERTLLGAINDASKSDKKAAEKLKSVFISHLSYVEKRKGVSFAIINETINLKDKDLQKRMLRVLEAYYKKIEGLLVLGIQSGEFRKNIDTESASIAFFGMVQSLVTLWALCAYKPRIIVTHVPRMFDLYINGIIQM